MHEAILQLGPEFIFSSLIFEFGNASKATSCVRCNIIIGQPQFANLFLIPYLDGEKFFRLCHSDSSQNPIKHCWYNLIISKDKNIPKRLNAFQRNTV